MSQYAVAFALTLFAGLATVLGSVIAFLPWRNRERFLSVALGFSAGVMVYISGAELLPDAWAGLVDHHGALRGALTTIGGFLLGVGFIVLVDRCIPEEQNPHEVLRRQCRVDHPRHRRRLMRTGMFTALAIAIHNVPEGLITFAGAMKDLELGIALAIAVALHNIPEGIAVAMPIYHASGSKRRAFIMAFLSGITEPIGALLAYWVLALILEGAIMGILFAAIAGVMVFISLDQLLPMACANRQHRRGFFGFAIGVAFMAFSLALL